MTRFRRCIPQRCMEMGVSFLGKVPLDPQLCKAAEDGKSCFVEQTCSVSAPALKNTVEKMMAKYWREEMYVEQ